MSKDLHIAYILDRNVQMCADHADLYGFQFLSLVFLHHLHRHGLAVLPLAQDGEWKAGHGHRENCHFLSHNSFNVTTGVCLKMLG